MEALAVYSGRPGSPIGRIIAREELRHLESNPTAAFALDPASGVTFSHSADGEVLAPSRVEGMHGQMPDRPQMSAVFVITGPGIPRGRHLETVQMLDVAPTLASLAGLKLPDAQGKPIPTLVSGRPR
jgi:hypothetical protein